MEPENSSKTFSGLNAETNFANPKTDQCSTVTKETEKADKLDSRNDANSAKATPKPSLKRKKPNHPPTSQMVLESIKSLKMPKGASAEAIFEFIEGHYNVSAKQMKPYVDRFLKSGVEKGILELVSGVGAKRRFKIKKTEQVTVKAAKLDSKNDTKSEKVTSKPPLKRKRLNHPPTSQMVLESIKSLNMSKGASAEAIGGFMDEYYGVSAKEMKPYVDRFLKAEIEKGTLELVSEVGAKERFKIKKTKQISEKAGKLDLKNYAKSAKVASKPSPKRIKPNHPPTSQMVLESMKSLKKPKGASAEAIGEFIEEHYGVSAKQMKPYVDRFLKSGVEKGILELVSGVRAKERFKIKKSEQAKVSKVNLKLNPKKRMEPNAK